MNHSPFLEFFADDEYFSINVISSKDQTIHFLIVSSTLSFIKKSQCPIMSRGRPLASIIFLGLVNLLIFNLLSFATSQPMMQTEAPVSNKNCYCDWFDLKFVFLLMSHWTVLSESFARFFLLSTLFTSFSVSVG